MTNHLKLFHNLRSKKRSSARTAVDYMEGKQLEHLKEYLDLEGFGIKKWRERGVLPLFENVTGHVIDQSAKTYQQAPSRMVMNKAGDLDDAATDTYNELIAESNLPETLQHCDLLSRLLKTSVILAQYDDDNKRLFFEAMSQDNCDVTYSRKKRQIDSMLYTGGSISIDGNQIYHYWTEDKVVDYEHAFQAGGHGALKLIDTETNPFGMIPSSVLYDTQAPRFGFWSDSEWDELIQFNLAVNMFHTEMKFNQRYGAIGALFTDADIEGVVGPDAVVKLIKKFQTETPYLAYESPDVQIQQFLDWLNGFRESVGRNWGVNIKMHGDASADSGFKLVVEELPTLELRKKRLPAAQTFEQGLYQSILAISKAKQLGLPEGSKLNVEFPEPDLPVNKKEQWEISQGEMAFGVLTKKDYLKQKNPTWTDDQVEEYLAAVQAEKGAAAPAFNDIVDTEEDEGGEE